MAASEVESLESASTCCGLGGGESTENRSDGDVAADDPASFPKEEEEGEEEEGAAVAAAAAGTEAAASTSPEASGASEKSPAERSVFPSLSLSAQLRPSQALRSVISIGLSPRTMVAPTRRAAVVGVVVVDGEREQFSLLLLWLSRGSEFFWHFFLLFLLPFLLRPYSFSCSFFAGSGPGPDAA